MKRFFKWLLYVALAFLVFSIFQSPEQAASIVVGGFEGIASGIGRIFLFFDAILRQTGGDPAPAPAP